MNLNIFRSILLVLCFLYAHFTHLSGQVCSSPSSPTITVSLQNPVLVNPNEFQFDIVVTNTGTVPIKFSGLQFGLTMPSAPSGGTITASVTAPTSMPPLHVEAFPNSGPTGAITYTSSTFQIRHNGTPFLVENSSVIMPINQPMLYKRIKVVSSTAWTQSSTTLTFNTYTQSTSYTKNKLVNYCSGNPNSNTLTDNPNPQPIPDSPLLNFSTPLFVPLPVELLDFSAEVYNTRNSKLDWTTSSEENSDFFGIERSEDGVNWSAIGKVRAAGNSSETLKYQFIDSNLPMNRSKNQIFYYRLRMTDLDGKFEYSDIRGVNFSRSFAQGIEIYPNPATEMLNVDLTGFDISAGEVDLSVYDMTSKKLIGKKVIGHGIELIDISNIPGGTYQISIIQGSTQFKKNFIKLR